MDKNRAEDQAAGVDRRRLLKGAAAAGIGVTAWAAPGITSLGGTPVYAAMCTAGATSYSLGKRNTNCNCNSNTGSAKTARYKELGSACTAGPAFPGTAVMKNGSCAGSNITDSGSCPAGFNAASSPTNAGVCVTPTNPNLFCKTEVRVYQGGSCGGPYDVFFGEKGQGAKFLLLPGIPCQGGGNIFMEVFVTCSVENECV